MLRDYQRNIANQAFQILNELLIVYLAIEMRVGKSRIALELANMYKAKKVLFVTKKKAIKSIQADYDDEGHDYQIKIINFESIHKLEDLESYDFIIVDEAHSISAFPKPSKRTKQLKEIVKNKPLVLLSGTPSPETHSQIYHQFWISDNSPFKHKNFYKWAKEFVNVKERIINGYSINDYAAAKKEEISEVISPYLISFTQKEAGFKTADLQEEVFYVEMDRQIYLLMDHLVKNKYYKFKRQDEEVVCDTPVKLQNKLHQLSSGTVKSESGEYLILDTSKAKFIQEKYKGKKIAIFYKFIAEGMTLKKIFTNHTESPEEFNQSSDKVFISQMQSGSMGTNLSTADYLVLYNIDFSSTIYWQVRARLQTQDREAPVYVHWIFAKNGIEDNVLEAVQKKKSYTLYYFRRDYLNGSRISIAS